MTDRTTIVLETILGRKSVRHFTGAPVTKSCLLALLKAGMAAPSARNRQPVVFVAVTERQTLNTLGEGLPYTKMLYEANACIVVCGDATVPLQEGATDLWTQDAAAAAENILIATEAMGLGAVWSALYPYPEREGHVSKLLNLPPHITPFCIIPVGHPTGEDLPKEKFSQEKIRWEGW